MHKRAPEPPNESVGPSSVPGVHKDRSADSTGRKQVDFDRPPLSETFLGVQFAPLQNLSLPYFGVLWARIRDRYPTQQVKPPITAKVEEFAGSPPQGSVRVEVKVGSTEPDVRFWFIDRTQTHLLQVQRNRFIRNWRKGRTHPHDEYPRYAQLRPRFERDWQVFLDFLREEDLGAPVVNQCEVTYINHIELGLGWNAPGDAHRVLTMLQAQSGRTFLPEPEGLSLNLRYVMPENRGRLHLVVQPAVRRQDGKQVMQLVLSARGKPASSNLSDIVEWFDLGHEWIVRGFVDITTPALHAVWGRR